jgi:glyoxylase-like metal-dependent hydrolase (beta-lactamase superfamily II)
MTEPSDLITLVPNAGWDERIQVVRCGTLVDVFVVVSQRYVVLVDTLINSRTAAELLRIAAPHLAGRQLLVVDTHSHWDHCWGNQLFAGPGAPHPAPLIATRRCAELLATRAHEKLAEMRAGQPERFGEVVLTPPTLLFDERLRIDGGDLTLELFLTPGHAADHIAIYIPEIGTVLAGDAAELPFPFVESAATLPELRDSLARMAAMEPRVVLYCHAPGVSSPQLLHDNIAYFDEVERRCRDALASGATARPAEDADVEALVGFLFEAAIPAGHDPAQLAGFYRRGHHDAIRATLEHLSQTLPDQH